MTTNRTEPRYHQAHFRAESAAREFVEDLSRIRETWKRIAPDKFGEAGFGRRNENK